MNNSSVHKNKTPVSIVINKSEPHPDDMVCLSRAHTLEALKTLSPEAFFLYMHFALGESNETYQLVVPSFDDTTPPRL